VADTTPTRPEATYVRATARSLVREVVWWAACRHRPGPDRDICLFATRRGGSTWAMELIAANRGIRPMNQPLETLSRNLTLAQAFEVPRYPLGQITSLDERQAEGLHRYLKRLFDGEVVVNAPVRFWRSGFERVSDRTVLKITDAKAVIDWFDHTLDVDIVYFTRHPVPQALSCIRNGWNLTTDAYLADAAFCERRLGTAEGRCRDLAAQGTELERWVLNWAVENMAPLAHLADRPHWTHVRYEDTVLRPEEELQRLAERLNLRDVVAMHRRLQKPSVSSHASSASTRADIRRGDAGAVAYGWRKHVDAEDLVRSARVLELVGIDPSVVVPEW
jgi:hypothetical protein